MNTWTSGKRGSLSAGLEQGSRAAHGDVPSASLQPDPVADNRGVRFYALVVTPSHECKDPPDVVRMGYDAVADRYLDWSSDSPVRQQWLNRLLRLLSPASRVLDLGCGAGVPVAMSLAEAGHEVLGIDLSPAQIDRARRHVPSAEFRLADFSSVEFEESSFDAITAFYSITHVQRELHSILFRRIGKWLAPGGIFLASLGARDCTGWLGTWLGAENVLQPLRSRDEPSAAPLGWVSDSLP